MLTILPFLVLVAASAASASVTGSLVSQLGLIIGAVATLIGVIVTARASKSSNTRTAVLNEIQESRDAWRDDAESLRKRANEDATTHDIEMRDINARLDEVIRQSRQTREQYESDRFRLQSRLNEVILWCRQVAPILAQSGSPVPPAPRGVLLDDHGRNED